MSLRIPRWSTGSLAKLAMVAGTVVTTAGTLTVGLAGPAVASPGGRVPIVAAENEYGNVAAQIGGRYVTVSSVESNPNADPHSYEVSPEVATQIAGARIIIQNGLGYDEFMSKVESASPAAGRKVVDVQRLLGLPDDTANPHLWYRLDTMPAVAAALTRDLSALLPSRAAYFNANEARFVASLDPWMQAVADFKARYHGVTAATTEPVADYLLKAMGIENVTPWRFQADIMNGTDPTPQDVSLEDGFFAKHQVKVFCYNQQVVDQLTTSIRQAARKAGVPVVGVSETMPTPGFNYQRWMLAETDAIQRAVKSGASTEHI